MITKFEISKQEKKNYKKWLEDHNKTCKFFGEGGTTAGGRITFKFTPTGIGMGFAVECACGAEQDLTDFSDW